MIPKRTIRLCYRKIIEAGSQKPWDRYVWENSYQEFRMQFQAYNTANRYKLYTELVKEVKEAEKIPFLVSSAVVGYLKQLNGIMPDITNALGELVIPFKNYRFEIIESDVAGIEAHRIAVSFISEPLVWHDTVNSALLVSAGGRKDANDDALLTDMIAMQPFLSIFSIKSEVV